LFQAHSIIISCEFGTKYSITFEGLCIQGWFKSVWDARPVFSAALRALKNVVGCGCLLDGLLFFGTHDDRERKAQLVLYLEVSGAFHPVVLDKLRAAPQAVGP
jgi:hypothetical protein